MSALIAFFDAYPWAWFPAAGIAWAIFSALATTVLDRWIPKSQEDWAALYAAKPRLAAVARMLKAGGVNLPGFFGGLRDFVTGGPPAWLLGGPRGVVAGAIATGKGLQHAADVRALENAQPSPPTVAQDRAVAAAVRDHDDLPASPPGRVVK